MRYDSGVFQHAQEHAVDGPRGVFCITGESVRVYAESVHVLAVAHKVFDLPGGQRLDNRHKRVAQLVQAARGQAVGGAVGFPAAVLLCIRVLYQA